MPAQTISISLSSTPQPIYFHQKKDGIKEFEKCAKMFQSWRIEILDAFKYGIKNGVTEGFNNKIKVLKRSSYRLIWHAQKQHTVV
ncbi:transposase [Clostridium boliviensis]|uniref:transposase n=1 Tax=Clostridium boliviensis TaxID=318465 RepID=UPI0034DDEF78